MLKQYGCIRVHECYELYETAVFLRKRRWPKARGLAAVAPTGGNIVNLADAGAMYDLHWNPFTQATQDALAPLMPGYGKVGNPTDLTSAATGNQDFYRTALNTIVADPGVEVMIPIVPSPNRKDLGMTADIIKNCPKSAIMLWVGGCTDDVNYTRRDLIREGIPVYRDATPLTRAIRAAYDFGQFVSRTRSGELTPQRPANIDESRARVLLAGMGSSITEREAKQILACYGLPVTQEALACSAEEAAQLAQKAGAPVAMKIDSPDIAHKTEAGGVKLGVTGRPAAEAAYRDILQSAKQYAPHARMNGVQEMAKPGVEMMLGVVRDPVFGAIVVAGLGGIFVEVLKDVSYRVAPVAPAQAAEMLEELRGKKMLDGVRGMAPRDREALIDAIVRLSWFAHDFRNEVAELDVNPLVAYERGAGVRLLDALIVRAP